MKIEFHLIVPALERMILKIFRKIEFSILFRKILKNEFEMFLK